MSASTYRWLRLGVVALGLALTQSAAFAQTDAAKPFLDEAGEATSAGRYVDALAAYAGAIVAAPDDAGAHVQRADLFVSLGHPELAARDYRVAARIKPDDVRMQNGLCRNLALANHDLDGALTACDAAVRLAPRDPVVLATRGYLQLRRGAWVKAEADFAASLDLSPASPDEMYGHGIARIHLGQARAGLDEMSSATLDSSGLPLEWEARGFNMQGDAAPGRPVTTASQAVARVDGLTLFLNKGETFVPVDNSCGAIVQARNTQRQAITDEAIWTGACRFGLAHGEGKFAPTVGSSASVTRFVYGREITGPDSAAIVQKLDLAYRAAEEATLP